MNNRANTVTLTINMNEHCVDTNVTFLLSNHVCSTDDNCSQLSSKHVSAVGCSVLSFQPVDCGVQVTLRR